jgi:hypothetical protein
MKEGDNNHQAESMERIQIVYGKARPQDRPVCADGLSGVEAARIRRTMRRTPRSGR